MKLDPHTHLGAHRHLKCYLCGHAVKLEPAAYPIVRFYRGSLLDIGVACSQAHHTAAHILLDFAEDEMSAEDARAGGAF